MKNLAIIGIVAVCFGLTACSSGTRVDVAKAVDSTTAISLREQQQFVEMVATPLLKTTLLVQVMAVLPLL